MSARKGHVTVRHGKGGNPRTVPLNTDPAQPSSNGLRNAPTGYSTTPHRPTLSGLSRACRPISAKAIGTLVAKVGRDAGLGRLTPHILRHTFVTRLVRGGTDPFMVADLAGHARLETTLLYSLPSDADRRNAVETLSRP